MGYLTGNIAIDRNRWLELGPEDREDHRAFIDWLYAQRKAEFAERDSIAVAGFEASSKAEPNISSPPSSPTRGTFFDENVDLRDPEGHDLTTAVLSKVAEIESRRRRRKALDQENQYMLVRRILANGLRCYWHRDPAVASYFRKADAKAYQGKAMWLSGGAMSREVDLLWRAGLLDLVAGERSTASGYIVTASLLGLATTAGVSLSSVRRRIPADRLVRLFGPKGKPVFDPFEQKLTRESGAEIHFEPTTETEGWTSALHAFNDFLVQQDIGIATSPEEETLWATKLNEDEVHAGASYRVPERIQTDVYRVFNNGSSAALAFDQGGRMFGGWWVNAPKELRPLITINNQETIELDYAACHPNMLYHEHGLVCEGDPYEVPTIRNYELESEVATGTYRPCIKWLMQVLINGGSRPDLAERPPGTELPQAFSVRQIVEMIEDRHAPIAETFRSGAGLRLMRIESDIALEIITKARSQGWVALPIHDSFVTTVDRKKALNGLMIDEYRKVFHYDPSIKQAIASS